MKVGDFLAMTFMCHQRPDRSFYYKGKKFPLCARCTGVLIGYFVGIAAACITGCEKYMYFPLLVLPMIADGLVQQLFKKESNNIRRLITGILGGIGTVYIFISIHFFTIWWETLLLRHFNVIK